LSTIQRYVVTQTMKVLLAVLAGTSLALTLGGALQHGIREGLPPLVAFRSSLFLMPEMLRLTIPGSLLFAVCTVFGRMAATEEITALKSLGINPLRIVKAVLVLAYLLSLATFYVYELCATWSRPQLHRLVAGSVDQLAYNALRSDGVFKTDGVTVTVKTVKDGRLIQPRVEVNGRDGTPNISLQAKAAELQAVQSTGRVRLRCFDSQIKGPDGVAITLPDEFVQEIDVRLQRSGNEDRKSPAALRMSSIPRQVRRETCRVAELERETRRGAADDPETMEMLAGHRLRLNRLRAEPQRRLSNGFAVLAFAAIGIPVAIFRRSADNMSVFFTCFVPVALIYYPLLTAGETLARQGILPRLSVWMAPAALCLVGVVLLNLAVRR
jgi:lipopolysaccharide export system permease protein